MILQVETLDRSAADRLHIEAEVVEAQCNTLDPDPEALQEELQLDPLFEMIDLFRLGQLVTIKLRGDSLLCMDAHFNGINSWIVCHHTVIDIWRV
jgi:hypothetical protein